MKDLTATSFGLVIGFLLPGLAGLYCTTFWFPSAKATFDLVLTTKSDIGLFFLIVLAALIFGLQINLARWFLFEKWWCKSHKLKNENFKTLLNEKALEAFKASVDEHYRYHQFWGGMCIVMPFFYFGLIQAQAGISVVAYLCNWGSEVPQALTQRRFVVESLVFLVLEILTIAGAWNAFITGVKRGNSILAGVEVPVASAARTEREKKG